MRRLLPLNHLLYLFFLLSVPHSQSRMCDQTHLEITHTPTLTLTQHMGQAVPVLPSSLGDECWENLDHLIYRRTTLKLRLQHLWAYLQRQRRIDAAAIHIMDKQVLYAVLAFFF